MTPTTPIAKTSMKLTDRKGSTVMSVEVTASMLGTWVRVNNAWTTLTLAEFLHAHEKNTPELCRYVTSTAEFLRSQVQEING